MSVPYTRTALTGDASSATAVNAELAKIDTALGLCVNRSAQSTMQANLDMDNNDLVNAGNVDCSALAIGGTNITTSNATTIVWPYFSAHKDSNDQASFTTATFVKVTWDLDTADSSEFSTSNNRYTPGQTGYVQLNAAVTATVWVDGSRGAISIYKDGVEFKTVYSSRPGTAAQTFDISISDTCGASTYYEVFFWHDCGSDRTIEGDTTDSFFTGSVVSSQSA